MSNLTSTFHNQLASEFRIYNTLAREKQVFEPIEAGKVRMYVCGITVYDYCHIGHGRMMVAFDIVYRWLKALDYDVTYVRNITDIDDKIIKRAVENGETISQLTSRFITAMDEDMGALGVLTPDHVPRATQYVPQMLDIVERGEHEDGPCELVPSQCGTDGEAIETRQDHVEDRKVIRIGGRPLEGDLPINDDVGGMAIRTEGRAHGLGDGGLVLDDQDPQGTSST